MSESILFTPHDGWVGDVIPVANGDDDVTLYFLFEDRGASGAGMPWHQVSTTDFVNFTPERMGLVSGGADDEDFNAYTGSVIQDHEGVRHVFYTGQNPARTGADGQPLQLVCHAVQGLDGEWIKHPEWTFGAPTGYETADWRDPFVFWDEGSHQWRMLVAARHADGPSRRRGVIAQLASTDLHAWNPVEPFWDPRRYITHECPDVFQWGSWWYLVYSEFSDTFVTRYRIAHSPDGPWQVPEYDSIDGRAFYAAKSVARGDRRFFVGWIATKEGNADDGAYQWAGTMSALEAHQQVDGSLRFGFPREFLASFEPVEQLFASRNLVAPDGYVSEISAVEPPSRFLTRLTLQIEEGTRECGLLLRSSDDGDESYIVRLEPQRGRIVLDRWPRQQTGNAQWQISGDVPFAIELERPCPLPPGQHVIEALVDGDALVVVVDDRVALSARIYDRSSGRIGVFAGEGTVTITSLDILERSATPPSLTAQQTQSTEMEQR